MFTAIGKSAKQSEIGVVSWHFSASTFHQSITYKGQTKADDLSPRRAEPTFEVKVFKEPKQYRSSRRGQTILVASIIAKGYVQLDVTDSAVVLSVWGRRLRSIFSRQRRCAGRL